MTRQEGNVNASSLTRRRFIAGTAAVGASAYLAPVLAACGDSGTTAGGNAKRDVPWMTWEDHFVPGQLEAVAKQTGITAQPTFIDGSSAATLEKVRRTGGQFGMVSVDALWVPEYASDGGTAAFDLSSIATSKQLYSAAVDFDVWKSGSDHLAYPFSWATQPTFYNPKFVTEKPDSYQALLSPKYRNRITLVNDPIYVLGLAGLAVQAPEPFAMNSDQLAQAKDYLTELKPNILKFLSQPPEINRALANESVWICPGGNLGTDLQVQKINPSVQVESVFPEEGTIGFVDGELPVEAADDLEGFERWINAACTAEWQAKNFITNRRPLLNERAYKMLVDQGHGEVADRVFYNQPERAFEMVMNGPADDDGAYTDVFNEVFGG